MSQRHAGLGHVGLFFVLPPPGAEWRDDPGLGLAAVDGDPGEEEGVKAVSGREGEEETRSRAANKGR